MEPLCTSGIYHLEEEEGLREQYKKQLERNKAGDFKFELRQAGAFVQNTIGKFTNLNGCDGNQDWDESEYAVTNEP